MGKLFVQQVVTLDGFASDTEGEMAYFADFSEWEEIDRDNLPWLNGLDRVLLGATTYRLFVDFWPTPASADEIIAPRLNDMPKTVISSTLDSAPWGDFAPAEVERGDALETVRRLVRTDDVVLWGSLSLMNTLLKAGLVDVLQLRILPVTLGSGRPLFTVPFRATLESVRAYGDLVVETYIPRAR